NTYDIRNMVGATLIAAFGIHAGPAELEFGASAPFVIMSGNREPPDLGDPTNPNDDKLFPLSGQGIGSIGLHFKTPVLKTSRPPHLGLGVIASLYLPSTSPKSRFLGEDQTVPQVIGILDKEFGRQGRLRIALNAGIRIGQTRTFTDNDKTDGPTTPITN